MHFIKKIKILILLFVFLNFTSALALTELQDKLGPRPVDGVYIETVQSYLNPKQHQYGFDFRLWPLNPYYNGFSLDAYYSYYMDKDRAWEVINFSYLYTVDSGLTAELADIYSVRPSTIERTKFVLSSNYEWNVIYGKYIFLDRNIRYFRSSFLLGPALIVTTQASMIGVCAGWSVETFTNEKTSWKIQIRDNYAIGNPHPHNLAFLVGTSYGF